MIPSSPRTLSLIAAITLAPLFTHAADPIRTIIGFKGAVLALSYSPDGRRIAASDDRTPRWFRVPSFEAGSPELVEQSAKPVVLAARPGADAIVLLNRDDRVHRIDLQAMADRSVEVRAPEVLAVSVSPDGKWIGLAGGSQATFVGWDSDDQLRIRITNTALGFRSLTFSPDSRHVALGDHDSQIRVWALAGLEPAR